MSEYRGYKSYRHYLNAKLNAFAVKIAGASGAKDFLRQHVEKIYSEKDQHCNFDLDHDSSGVRVLTDAEAKKLYDELLAVVKKSNTSITSGGMTLGQRKAIIRITKYNFGWSPEATFSYILTVFPEKRKRLSSWEISNSKLLKLYTLISSKDANRLIKRLDQIKKRNEEKLN